MKILFLLVAAFLINTWSFSQHLNDRSSILGQRSLLMLEKKNKNKIVYYKTGELISFKVKGRKSKITGEIADFKDSVIVFKGFEVHVADIKCLYIDEKTKWWLRYKIAQLSFITGTGYLLLDVINTGQLNKNTLAVSGTVIGFGLLAKLLISNKIKIRGRTKLRILEL
jgi:hypothetical protein